MALSGQDIDPEWASICPSAQSGCNPWLWFVIMLRTTPAQMVLAAIRSDRVWRYAKLCHTTHGPPTQCLLLDGLVHTGRYRPMVVGRVEHGWTHLWAPKWALKGEMGIPRSLCTFSALRLVNAVHNSIQAASRGSSNKLQDIKMCPMCQSQMCQRKMGQSPIKGVIILKISIADGL